MKVLSIKDVKSKENVPVMDCYVDKGYIQGSGAVLPDVDIDYPGDGRAKVKRYIEQRYNHDGKQRVFSAGTFTTMKLKAALKDVCRVHKVPVSLVNYITAIFDNADMTWTELFMFAATNDKVKTFINKYPRVIEDIRTLMGQPRSSSIHASAFLVTPDTKDRKDYEACDFTPIKKVDGVLVSEFDGTTLDEQGLLKNDCLVINELSKLQSMINACNENYNAKMSFQQIAQGSLDDSKVYDLFKNGYTQAIFQFSSKGMTKFVMNMKPNTIEDLIAANALFRPATLESGSAGRYVDCKLGDAVPVYFWGTYDILKETYGVMTTQEQLAQMAREVGGFTLGEGVKLVKLISKKKVDKIRALKDKFMKGAEEKGCPKEDAIAIWDMIESGGSYLFNKCISGKEKIADFDNDFDGMTIGEMYEYAKKNKQPYAYYGKGWSLSENDKGRVLLGNDIVDIRYMGVRPVFEIVLESGKSVKTTLNHKHPTNNGVKMTGGLLVGVDKMYVVDKQLDEKKRSMTVKLETVESVEYVCDEDVYDVEMADPNHTFLTGNGIVTCNSHATSYSITAYIGAYIKANYPTAFYTVALQWADDDEIPALMNEMESCSDTKIVPPDINYSEDVYHTNYETNEIFWSLSRIKQLGAKAVDWIIKERKTNGQYTSIENFIERIFKYKLKKYQYWDDPDNPDEVSRCPVNARQVRNLILAGCFDKVENVKSVIERYVILEKAANCLGFKISEKDAPADLRGKHYFWSIQQINVSGIGAIDYKRIFNESDIRQAIKGRASWLSLKDVHEPGYDGKRVAICASIAEIEEKTFIDKKTGEDRVFCKLLLQQNKEVMEMAIWQDEWNVFKPDFMRYGAVSTAKGKVLICTAKVRYSEYYGGNNLQLYKTSILTII